MMPGFPSSSKVAAHRALHQAARQAAAPGVIIIGGVEYQCALHVGPIEHKTREDGGGFIKVQTLTATVSKVCLPTPPLSRAVIECYGETWRVDAPGGNDRTEAAWVITAVLFPTS